MRAGAQPHDAAALIAPLGATLLAHAHGLHATRVLESAVERPFDLRQFLILVALVLPWAWLAALDRWYRRKR